MPDERGKWHNITVSASLLVPAQRLSGRLALADGRISFVADSGCIFDEEASLLRVTFPWPYQGARMRVAAGRNTYRLALAREDGRAVRMALR